MRVRVESNADAVASFLEEQEYPCPWRASNLAEYTVMLRVETEKAERAGYAWANWHDRMPWTLDFHVCIKPEFRGRWLTQNVWDDLVVFARVLGAEALITHTPGDRPGRLVGALLTRRFGFKQVEPGVVYKRIMSNGISKTES